jgi:hypothetical protein
VTEYQTIEANGTTLILNEDMAINLYHALAREFHWAGTFFTRDDLAVTINERRQADDKELLSDNELDEAVDTIIGSRDWSKWLPDWMTEQGWEIINTAIYENLEQE